MIALVCKNLGCLISKHNSIVCKSHHVSFSISLHCFSTSRERVLVKSPRVYDILVDKHKFSPEFASQVASRIALFRKPENADSILSFLKESGFSSTQLERIVKYRARILTASVEDIKFKIKIFQDFGFSSEESVRLFSNQASILHLSAKNNIIPSLSLLKGLLGSNYNIARLLKKSVWFLSADFKKTLVPNVEFLESCGVPRERIVTFLYHFPRCLLIKPDTMRIAVDKVKEMGVSQSSRMFVYAVRIFASMSREAWELKLQDLQKLGFSNRDILTMFRKAPPVFGLSTEKIKKVVELLLATRKFNISNIVDTPSSLGCSIEKRYKPRLQILEILESKNLIKKWPNLGTIYVLTDKKFFEKFIRPYLNEVGEVYVRKSYVKGKR